MANGFPIFEYIHDFICCKVILNIAHDRPLTMWIHLSFLCKTIEPSYFINGSLSPWTIILYSPIGKEVIKFTISLLYWLTLRPCVRSPIFLLWLVMIFSSRICHGLCCKQASGYACNQVLKNHGQSLAIPKACTLGQRNDSLIPNLHV